MPSRHRPDGQPENLFLNEFEDCPWLFKRLSSRWGILALCGYVMLWASLAWLLGAYAGANCIQLTFTYGSKSAPLLFGYCAELNHGPFNLLGLPVFLYLVHGTLDAAEAGFQQLRAGNRLTRGGSGTKAFEWIRAVNRRFFRVWTWTSLVFALVIIGKGESMSNNQYTFGWVQARFDSSWRGVPLTDLKMNGVPNAVAEPLGLTNSAAAAAAVTNGSVRIAQAHAFGGSNTPSQRAIGYVFLVVALGLQGFFLATGFWVIGKLVFIFLLLFGGFRNADQGDSQGLKLELNLRDPGRRFGLRMFDAVYDNALGMIAVGSLAFTLQHISNTAKGTTFGLFEHAPFFGQLISLVLLAGLFMLVLLFPGMLFMRHANGARNDECQRLEKELAALREQIKAKKSKASRQSLEAIRQEIAGLEAELNLAQDQTPWPANDVFRGLLGLIAGLLILIPLGLPEEAANYGKPLNDYCCQQLPQKLCQLEGEVEHYLPWITQGGAP